MWKSLIWKEWHEQRWKLAFGCVTLLTGAFVGLHTRIGPDEGVIAMVIFFGAILLPLLNAMGLVAAERDEGSFGTLMRLPVSPRRVYVVKTLMGVAVVTAPILAAGAIALLLAAGREVAAGEILAIFALASVMATSFFLWTSVAGMRQPTEARAAVAGIVILALWAVLVLLVIILTGDDEHWFTHASPFGWLGVYYFPDYSWLVVLTQTATMAGLWLWGMRRFTRPLKNR